MCEVQGLWFRVQGVGCRLPIVLCRVEMSGSGCRVWGCMGETLKPLERCRVWGAG